LIVGGDDDVDLALLDHLLADRGRGFLPLDLVSGDAQLTAMIFVTSTSNPPACR
jgi:hypothetical protein